MSGPRARHRDPAVDERVRAAIADGWSLDEIHRTFGVYPAVLRRVYGYTGWGASEGPSFSMWRRRLIEDALVRGVDLRSIV